MIKQGHCPLCETTDHKVFQLQGVTPPESKNRYILLVYKAVLSDGGSRGKLMGEYPLESMNVPFKFRSINFFMII